MPHHTAAQHGSRERIGPRPFVRTPVPDLDGLLGGPRRLPSRLRRRPVWSSAGLSDTRSARQRLIDGVPR